MIVNHIYKILKEAINRWGIRDQIDQTIEELSELITALLHYKRDKCIRSDVLDERCDVGIMLKQLDIIYNFTEIEINTVMNDKINKLKNKLNRF